MGIERNPMNIKVPLLILTSILISGCTLPQSAKIITGGAVSTNLNENTIQIKNYAFDPSDINVTGGSIITITNDDSVAHTVTADDESFDTGLIQPGKSIKLEIPPKDGIYEYASTPYPYMRGKMIVSNSPTPTPEEK